MNSIKLGYGRSVCTVSLPKSDVVLLTQRPLSSAPPAGEALIRRALKAPYGTERLSGLVRRGQRVVILVSDITRPCPTAQLLPPLLSELAEAGVRERDISVVFARGSHRRMTPEEQSGLVGESTFRRIGCEDFDDQFVEVGHTERDTPVQIPRPVVEADWRILTGNIEYHYFAGYTGGVKALLPGVCSVETVQANHSRMVLDSAAAGRIEGNPVREDIDEAVAFVGPSFLLNVVLDSHGQIVEAVAGDVTLAHRQGCRKVDELYRVPIDEPADIVLASAGGWPKDINLYQAHKTLENAAQAVRDGGIIILLAECGEGFGHPSFEEWMTCGDSPDALLERLQERFVLGGHKAAAIAKIRRRPVRVFLVSSFDAGVVRSMGFEPYPSAQEALAAAQGETGHAALLAVIPHAGLILPVTTT